MPLPSRWLQGLLCQGVVRSQGLGIPGWGEFHPEGSQATSSATEPPCGEQRWPGEGCHHCPLVLNQGGKAGALPQQRSPKAYETSLQKPPP